MEDSQIIDLYWQRSENAIAETSAKYGKLLRKIALNIVGNFSDAEECENDTYVATWNAIPPTRPNILSAFLGKIARNIALNRYEYNKAQKRNNEFDLVLSELEECIASKSTVEESVEEGLIASMLDEFLESLIENTHTTFALQVAGVFFAEGAARRGRHIPITNVWARLPNGDHILCGRLQLVFPPPW